MSGGCAVLYFHLIPLWGVFAISIGLGVVAAVVVRFFVNPRLGRWIESLGPVLACSEE